MKDTISDFEKDFDIPIENGHCFCVPDLNKWVFILWDEGKFKHAGNPPETAKHRTPYYIKIDENTDHDELDEKFTRAIQECKGK